MSDNRHWVGTWAASPAPAEGAAFGNHTIRMNPRISLGGSVVRVRISNAYGNRPLAIGAARIALRDKGAAIVPATDRRLTFGGEAKATIAAGAVIVSDPVDLEIPPWPISRSASTCRRICRRALASPAAMRGRPIIFRRSATSPPRRQCRSASSPTIGISSAASMSWRPTETLGIVAVGDSLTDANISTHDGHHSWPSQLARRLIARSSQGGGRPAAVMNQGLGGNRILHDLRGDSGLRRFDRDVLAQPGVTHAIIMLGTNDLRNRWAKPEEEVTAEQMIAGLKQMALRGQAREIKMLGCTLTPYWNETFLPGAWNPRRETVRQAVNAWLREGSAFDSLIDFDRALRDPENPLRMVPQFDCGDHLHPSDLGYRTMGDAIDLALFEQ